MPPKASPVTTQDAVAAADTAANIAADAQKAVADAADKLDRELYEPLTKGGNPLGDAPSVGEVDNWLKGIRDGLTGILLSDAKDKNKYKLTYPK